MGKIATEQEAYAIAGGNESTISKICCTKLRAIDIGCEVKGNYSNNQLVQKDNLAQGVNYLTVTVEGEKVSIIPKYGEVPQSTISNQRFSLVFTDGVIMGSNLVWNWDEEGKYWWLYSRYSIRPDASIDPSASTMTITQDSKYKYAFAEIEKMLVRFQFVLVEDRVYLNLDREGRAEFDGPIVTNIGSFYIDTEFYYSGANSQSVEVGFDINSIVVQTIPTSSTVTLEQGKFPVSTFSIVTQAASGLDRTDWNGHIQINIGNYQYAGGIISNSYTAPFYSYGDIMYLTYNGNFTSWKVRVRGTTYDLKPYVKTSVGMFLGNTVIDVLSYVP